LASKADQLADPGDDGPAGALSVVDRFA